MSLDPRLVNLLVCPVCKGPLEMRRDAESRPVHFPWVYIAQPTEVREIIEEAIRHVPGRGSQRR